MEPKEIIEVLHVLNCEYGARLKIGDLLSRMTEVLSELWGTLDQRHYGALLNVAVLLLRLNAENEISSATEANALLGRLRLGSGA